LATEGYIPAAVGVVDRRRNFMRRCYLGPAVRNDPWDRARTERLENTGLDR